MFAWEYAQQLICKQTFLFCFCFVNKQLKSSDCISAAACMMWLFWFGLQLLFVFWTVEFCQFLHDFFVHNSHRIVPPYHKILHNYWLLVLLCILVFTKCNGRDFFTKSKLDWQGISFLEKLRFSNQPNDKTYFHL